MKNYTLEQIEMAIFNHDNCGETSEESHKKRCSEWRSIKNYLTEHEDEEMANEKINTKK